MVTDDGFLLWLQHTRVSLIYRSYVWISIYMYNIYIYIIYIYYIYVSTCVCLDCAYTLPLHLRVPVTYFSIDDSRRSYCSAPCSWMMRCIDEIIHKSKLCFWKPWEKNPYFMAVENRVSMMMKHDSICRRVTIQNWFLDDHWMIIGHWMAIGWLGREITQYL